jgi:uncharacterized membrane protein YkoI
MRTLWKNTALAGTAGLLLAAALAGCSGDPGQSSGTAARVSKAPAGSWTAGTSKSGSPSGSSAGPSRTVISPASVRGAERALDTAERAVPGSDAYGIEHDDEGPRDWEVKLAARNGGEYDGKQYVVRVSDDGGKVTGEREQTERDDDAAKLNDGKVPLKQAVRMASGRHPSEELSAAEIDRVGKGTAFGREGTAVWQVHTANPASASPNAQGENDVAETETVIDAGTGRHLADRKDE